MEEARCLRAGRLQLLLRLRRVVGAGGGGLALRDAIAEIHAADKAGEGDDADDVPAAQGG